MAKARSRQHCVKLKNLAEKMLGKTTIIKDIFCIGFCIVNVFLIIENDSVGILNAWHKIYFRTG